MSTKIQFHHENSGNCTTTFKAIDKEMYYNRIEGNNGDGCWCTVCPSQGYWESDTPVRDDVMFEVVDDTGQILFTESNGDLGSFRSISRKAKEISKDYAAKLSLSPYEEWKEWLLADMSAYGYRGCSENWLHAETGIRGSEIIGRYKHLGIEFIVYRERMDHIICGKKWRYFYICNSISGNTEALCGFLFNWGD